MEKSADGPGEWTVGSKKPRTRQSRVAGRAAGARGEGPPTTGTWPACRRSPVKQRADQQLENHLWKGAIAALEERGPAWGPPRLTGVCLSRAW